MGIMFVFSSVVFWPKVPLPGKINICMLFPDFIYIAKNIRT